MKENYKSLIFCWLNPQVQLSDANKIFIIGTMEDKPFSISDKYPELHGKVKGLGFKEFSNSYYALNVNER